MSNIIKQIAARAKQIRRKHPSKKWTDCIKQASREIKKGAKPASKKGATAKKKARKVGAVKYRQTGSSNRKRDKERKALPPGKRVVKRADGKTHVYYERRKNRSDKPGALSGTGISSLLSLYKLSKGNFDRLKNELKEAEAKYKSQKDRGIKIILKVRVDRLKYEIRERKQVMAALATDLRRISKNK